MRYYLFYSLCCLISLSVKTQQPLPDCKDMKEKIVTIQNSLDKLMSFKKTETGKNGSETVYSSDFEFCVKKASVKEENQSITLQFDFKSEDYTADVYAFSNFKNKILEILKEVFVKWTKEQSENNEDEYRAITNYFYESGKSMFFTKNYIKLYTYITDDSRTFSLEFVHWKD
jgi:hypothetical protein